MRDAGPARRRELLLVDTMGRPPCARGAPAGRAEARRDCGRGRRAGGGETYVARPYGGTRGDRGRCPRTARMRALITGITGQDGSYLAELLVSKGYEVHGLIRRASSFNTGRLESFYRDRDVTDAGALQRLLWEVAPDEVYHLAAQSHVRVSFDVPEYTADVTALGTLR